MLAERFTAGAGTEGSNPVPSSAEAANFRFLAITRCFSHQAQVLSRHWDFWARLLAAVRLTTGPRSRNPFAPPEARRTRAARSDENKAGNAPVRRAMIQLACAFCRLQKESISSDPPTGPRFPELLVCRHPICRCDRLSISRRNECEPSVSVSRPATRTTFDDTSCIVDEDALSTLHYRDAKQVDWLLSVSADSISCGRRSKGCPIQSREVTQSTPRSRTW